MLAPPGRAAYVEGVDASDLRALVVATLVELVAQQEAKVLACAAAIDPRLTPDDLLQPHDFPQVAGDARFNYEDGILAGLRSAEAALRAALAR
jgi:hypothetical protein